jgi:hypothetical protein
LDTWVFKVGSFATNYKDSIITTTSSSTSFSPFGSTSTIELVHFARMGGRYWESTTKLLDVMTRREHKKATIDNGIPIWTEIQKLVRT